MLAKYIVERLFKAAHVTLNGNQTWDPQIKDDRFYRSVLLGGSVAMGESYMKGWWTCERVDIMVMKVMKSGIPDMIPRFDDWWLRITSLLTDRQDKKGSVANVRAHYDSDPSFFIDVLGETNSYTCGRWGGVKTLDEAQTQKMSLMCRKAFVSAGKKVLDIGCGWGGTLAHAARAFGAQGIGISLSPTQVAYASNRYGNLPIEFRVQDYRDFNEKVDAAVSVCMIEHVGPKHLREYFEKVKQVLDPRGWLALQCITARAPADTRDAWLDKYIFPGGRLITKEWLTTATKGLLIKHDEEFFGQDYVRTLHAWCANLRGKQTDIVKQYGLEHYKMFEYYFMLCAGAFASGIINVGQMVYSPTDQRDGYRPVRLADA